MTEREKLDFFEKKSKLYFKSGGVCGAYGCGRPLQYNNFQLGHHIPQSMLDKYGPEIIHHELNMTPVCCLECNKKVDIGTRPGSILVLLEQILEALNKSFELEDYKAELLEEIRVNEREEENKIYEDQDSGHPTISEEEQSGEVEDIFGRSKEELDGFI